MKKQRGEYYDEQLEKQRAGLPPYAPTKNFYPNFKAGQERKLEMLIKLPMIGRGVDRIPKCKMVTVNDVELSFMLGKKNEYWRNKVSLTEYLIAQARTGQAKVSIR